MKKKDKSKKKDELESDRYRDVLSKALLKLKDALAQESAETKEMLEIYFRFTLGKASAEELQKAEKQLQDVIRAAGLTVFGILPLAPLTIPALIKLAEKFGIEILPSSFRPDKPDDADVE